jgi:flagella basal body P-ring formation protein FlgA
MTTPITFPAPTANWGEVLWPNISRATPAAPFGREQAKGNDMPKGSTDIGQHMLELARSLYEGATITRQDIETRFGVSRATAKRYIARLEQALPVTATRSARAPTVLRLTVSQS